jgi:acyl-CoA synthetase (AMP-forming)/AMP-acid ligase II
MSEFEYWGVPGPDLTVTSVAPMIMRHGTERNKTEWLPLIAKGEMICAVGYSEPEAGTDLANLRTRATRDGEEWVINGTKIWNSGAQRATHEWLCVRTDPNGVRHQGISVIIVPIDSPGVEIRPLYAWSGYRTNEVHFRDVRVPATNLVGEINRGWTYVTADDVCYLAMPLFHSNGVAAGWAVAIGSGALMVPAKFSPSRFLEDVRRYKVTYLNYVGKPLALILATPERPDDADTTLRVAFGNEATDRDIAEFARRFGCRVVDSFGSSEFAVIVVREDGAPPGSIGKPYPGVSIYHPTTLKECAIARFDEHGALTNFHDAVGELVNTQGAGPFTGYYNDPSATAERMRHGMYWSGDLAYRDADGWIYLAGRTADWMRVDGENLAAAPIERILERLPQVSQVAVYAVPDQRVGDQVMAALVLRSGIRLEPADFEEFLAAQPDLSPKAWPRFVRINDDLPVTATNKILKRALIASGISAQGGELWTREARGTTYNVTVPYARAKPTAAQPVSKDGTRYLNWTRRD